MTFRNSQSPMALRSFEGTSDLLRSKADFDFQVAAIAYAKKYNTFLLRHIAKK